MQVREANNTDADALFGMARSFATSTRVYRTAFDRVLTTMLTDDRQLLLVALVEGASERVGYLHGLVHPAFHANGTVSPGWGSCGLMASIVVPVWLDH